MHHGLVDTLIPMPRRRELGHVDVAAPPLEVWKALHHGRMAWPLPVRAVRRIRGRSLPGEPLALGKLRSTPKQPGLLLLGEEPGRELTLGAVAAMGVVTFELLPVADLDAFARLTGPGLVRLVWSMRLSAIGAASSRLRVELRMDAVDTLTWQRFRRAYVVIGPLLRLLQRRVLAALADQFGAPELTAPAAATRGASARAE